MHTAPSALRMFVQRLVRRSPLSAEEGRAILSLPVNAHQVRANYDFVAPGQTVDYSCLVAHGLAARYDQMTDGKRQITALYVPGDMCDLHSVLCPTAAWGMLALSATTILRVPHVELCRLINKYPAIAFAFWRDGIADGSILAKWTGNLGRRDARARLAHVICEMGVRIECLGDERRDAFWFDVSQQNLADVLGMTAVHVNRTLQSLRTQKLIRTESRRIFIDDWDRLAALAEFSSDYLLLEGQMEAACQALPVENHSSGGPEVQP